MRQAGEPTVEEILESIKKVIARDNRAGALDDRRLREADGADDGDLDDSALDVLELADSEAVNGNAPLMLDDAYDTEDGDALTLEDDDADVEDAPLVNAGSRASMRESLAALAVLAKPGVPPQIVRSGETSLEELTRDLLRPALADWLDKNLPPLVEKMVATEIARIVGKRG